MVAISIDLENEEKLLRAEALAILAAMKAAARTLDQRSMLSFP
jgi:hypothetical protein